MTLRLGLLNGMYTVNADIIGQLPTFSHEFSCTAVPDLQAFDNWAGQNMDIIVAIKLFIVILG